MIEAANDAQPHDLATIIKIAECERDFGTEVLGITAVRILPAWGSAGVAALDSIVREGYWSEFALVGLFQVLSTPCDMKFESGLPGVTFCLPQEAVIRAEMALQDLAASAARDVGVFKRLYEIGASLCAFGLDRFQDTFSQLMKILTGARLVVNESVIAEFDKLLNSEHPKEERIHRFLAANPTLLDPLAQQVWSKHELGDDFITDFVVRRMNNEYVLIEIERPGYALFNKAGALSSKANLAIAQVRDFQRWITENIAYAQRKLPGIVRPEGCVIIGRRTRLSPENALRLDEENFIRRGQARILTFDDLVSQARTVRKNLLLNTIVQRSADAPRF